MLNISELVVKMYENLKLKIYNFKITYHEPHC